MKTTTKKKVTRARPERRPDVRNVFARDLRVGDEMIGVYRESILDEKIDAYRHHFSTTDGPLVVFGTTVLDGELEKIELGTEVLIVYQGIVRRQKAKGGRDWQVIFPAKNGHGVKLLTAIFRTARAT